MSDIADRASKREEEFLADALARVKRQARQGTHSAVYCGELLDDDDGCGAVIGALRRIAVPGVQLCTECQQRRERVQRMYLK